MGADSDIADEVAAPAATARQVDVCDGGCAGGRRERFRSARGSRSGSVGRDGSAGSFGRRARGKGRGSGIAPAPNGRLIGMAATWSSRRWWHIMLKDRDDCSSAGLVGRCCRHARNCCGRGETYMPADRIEQSEHVVRQRMHFPFFNPSGPVDRRPAVPRIAGPGRAVSAPGQQEYTVRRPLARAGRPLGRRFDILHTVSFASAIGALSNARFFNFV